MLQIESIKKSYGSHEVLNIKKLQLPKGFYWIKGSNGSGKSTLLKVLAGLIPFKGDVTIHGKFSIRKNPVAYRSLINHAPAEPAYPTFLNGQELVDFYMKIKKGTIAELSRLKDILGIDDYINNPCGSYSSGMLKKLSLLLAFIGKSEWIFLDEPFTTLDTKTQHALLELIKNNADKGFILTSHHDISPADISFDGIYHLANKTIRIEPAE